MKCALLAIGVILLSFVPAQECPFSNLLNTTKNSQQNRIITGLIINENSERDGQ